MLLLSSQLRRALAATGLSLSLLLPAQAQTAPTLRQALDAAWALSPASRAATHRLDELQARERAAQSLVSGPLSATLAHRTDRLNANGGLREYEADLELPLWNPGVRSATQRQTGAERAAFEPQQALARLKLAGELRALAAQAAQARAERELAVRKLDEATHLAADVERRVKAGDTARVDALQSQAAARQAGGAVAQADAALSSAQQQWRALTGLALPGTLDEQPGTATDHPAMLAAQAQLRATQARLALADADRRDPMALAVGVTRERATTGAAAETSLRFALRIPLGGDTRNAARLAAARAELDTAQAEADAATRQTSADQSAATAALDAARRNENLAAQRATLATQVQVLLVKAYQLGESDLPTRLRADNDKFDADLSLARARIDVQRATAKLNQALGLLP